MGGPEGLSPGFEAGAEEVGVHVEEVDGEGTAGCGVDGSADGVGPVGGVGLCGHEEEGGCLQDYQGVGVAPYPGLMQGAEGEEVEEGGYDNHYEGHRATLGCGVIC